MIKVLLLDNQLLTAQGITALLVDEDYYVSNVRYHNLGDIESTIAAHPYDLLIIDPLDDNDILDEAMLNLLEKYAALMPVIALTNVAQPDILKALLTAGISYHISKQASPNEIFECLKSALRGKPYQCSRTRELLASSDNLHPLIAILSDREKEIVIMIADGKADKEIADALFLSYHTVRTHRKNIGRKLGFSLKNAAELTNLANALR